MRIYCIIALVFLLTGCASTQLTIEASRDLNGGGNAANIDIYQLVGKDRLESSSHQEFWAQGGNPAGEDVIKKRIPDSAFARRDSNVKN